MGSGESHFQFNHGYLPQTGSQFSQILLCDFDDVMTRREVEKSTEMDPFQLCCMNLRCNEITRLCRRE